MSFEFGDIERLKLQIQRLAFVPQVANEELKRIAEDVKQKAQDMAPIDYGDLKDSIQVRRVGVQGAGGRFIKGWSNYEVFVNNAHPVADPDKIKHGVDTVGEYVWLVHEYMGYGDQPGYMPGTGRSFMPSDKSVQAGQAKGVQAGGRFLERAAIEMTASANERLSKVIQKEIASLDN